MTLEDTVLIVKSHVNNWFNAENDPEALPVESMDYRVFKKVCEMIHAYMESDAGKVTGIVSESVLGGKHSYSVGTGKDGAPLGWQELFAKDLNQFRRMRL